MKWLNDKVAPPSEVHYEKALAHQRQLTKPPGSLGRLEDLAARLAAMQRTERPALDAISVAVFAADHGIAEAGVSAFPQAVTREMVKNFMRGGAACNVLAGCVGADFEAVDAGLLAPLEISGLVSDRAGPGTVNFLNGPAMSEAQLAHAVAAGRRAVARALERRAQLFIGGDMGIGNTTSAAALGCALLDEAPEHLTGAGTGLDPNGIRHKAGVIEQALTRHRSASTAPLAAMQCLGGFEIAALTGAYVFAAQQGLPVLIDGFISSVAALCAVRINPAAGAWFLYAHVSHEQGHRKVLQALAARPLLDLDMRLGEASGALAAVPLLRMAVKLHNDMATFEQAGVPTQ